MCDSSQYILLPLLPFNDHFPGPFFHLFQKLTSGVNGTGLVFYKSNILSVTLLSVSKR